LLQGMMKHLIRWLIRVFRPGEISVCSMKSGG
jgi:hypothetical protein